MRGPPAAAVHLRCRRPRGARATLASRPARRQPRQAHTRRTRATQNGSATSSHALSQRSRSPSGLTEPAVATDVALTVLEPGQRLEIAKPAETVGFERKRRAVVEDEREARSGSGDRAKPLSISSTSLECGRTSKASAPRSTAAVTVSSRHPQPEWPRPRGRHRPGRGSPQRTRAIRPG